jgi:hypothetical protein
MKRYPEIFKKDIGRVDGYNACLEPLMELFALPYWQRVWILQEIALAEDALIMARSVVIDRRAMVVFHNLLHEMMMGRFEKPPFIPAEGWFWLQQIHLEPAAALVFMEGGKVVMDLEPADRYQLVPFTIDHLATDPRDKVFGL